VPNSADHRYRGRKDSPHQIFVIECTQVGRRAAAARDDDDIRGISLEQRLEGSNQIGRGPVALHRGRRQQETREGIPTADHILDVVPDRAGR
jgi:hypothetical protein